jgi:hypothetical protein
MVVGSMIEPRCGAGAATLGNGTVLISGGYTTTGLTDITEIYNPTTQTFSAGPPIEVEPSPSQPDQFTTTLLGSGTVAVADGSTLNVFSPGTNSFTSSTLIDVRDTPASISLPNGSLMLIGGFPYAYTADLITFGVAVSSPRPSIAGCVFNSTTCSGYDFTAGARILLDGVLQSITYVASSEQIELSGLPTSGTHTIQVKNPDGQVSNIIPLIVP